MNRWPWKRRRGGDGGQPAPAAASVTWTALAEATARVTACYHDLADPGPSGDLDADTVATVLAVMCAAILTALPPRDVGELLEAFGARAAAGSISEGKSP